MSIYDIIDYELDDLGPKDRIEMLYRLSSWAIASAELVEAEEALINYEAGLEAEPEDESNFLVCGESCPCITVHQYEADFS